MKLKIFTLSILFIMAIASNVRSEPVYSPSSGGGTTAGGSVTKVTDDGNAFAIGCDATADSCDETNSKVFFDSVGNIFLSEPGKGINVTPPATTGSAMVLGEAGDSAGDNTFTLDVAAALNSDYKCTVGSDGSWSGTSCPAGTNVILNTYGSLQTAVIEIKLADWGDTNSYLCEASGDNCVTVLNTGDTSSSAAFSIILDGSTPTSGSHTAGSELITLGDDTANEAYKITLAIERSPSNSSDECTIKGYYDDLTDLVGEPGTRTAAYGTAFIGSHAYSSVGGSDYATNGQVIGVYRHGTMASQTNCEWTSSSNGTAIIMVERLSS